VISVIVTEELETILIGPKWTQNKDLMQPRKQQATDYHSDVGWRCPGRTSDTLLARTGKEIYLIGSIGFVLYRSTRFCA
jgi:hypothetical protein